MKGRFNWIHTGGPFGDATDNYIIEFDKPLKVSEFIEYVRSQKEWAHFYFDNVYPWECELHRDGRDIKPCPEKYLDREIESIDANGGWGNYGYDIKLVAKEEAEHPTTEHLNADRPMTKGEVIDLIANVMANTHRCADCLEYTPMRCDPNRGCVENFRDFIWRLAQ